MPRRRPTLTHAQVLSWADEHHARTGRSPNAASGEVSASPHETWNSLNHAQSQGLRALSGGDTHGPLAGRAGAGTDNTQGRGRSRPVEEAGPEHPERNMP